MNITIDNIMDLHPCPAYSRSRARVAELWAGRESLTLVEICDLEILAQDRLWAVSQLMPQSDARLLAADYAERVLHLIPESHRAPFRTVIATARAFARGEASRAELAAAEDAAQDATWATWTEDAALEAAWAAALDAAGAASDAALDAAWDAALDAAWEAAKASAGEAAGDTAGEPAWEAAWEAAWAEQIAMLRTRCVAIETVLT